VLKRAVTINVLGQVGSLVVGFFGSILIARWLGPADRGLLGLIASTSGFAVALFGLGWPLGVMYFASKREASQGALLGDTVAFAAVLALVLVPLAYVFRGTLADTFGRGRGDLLWVAAAALVPLTLLEYSVPNQLAGRFRWGLRNALNVLSKLAYLAVAIVLIGVLDLGVAGGVIALATASVVIALGSVPALVHIERPRIDLSIARELFRYGRRVQIGTVFQLANYRLDVIVAQFFISLSAVGAYVMAQVLAELVIVIAQSFQTSVLPLVARDEGGESTLGTTTASLRHHGILAAAAIAGNAVFGTLVILFALGHGYRQALTPFLILLPAVWFLGTGAVVGGVLRGRGQPGAASALSGAAVIVTVVLDLALIPPFGITGAALASLCAYIVFGTSSAMYLARTIGVPVGTLLRPTRADLALYARLPRRRFSKGTS
jgi:O-antigen/teichoic acid export membrane protein